MSVSSVKTGEKSSVEKRLHPGPLSTNLTQPSTRQTDDNVAIKDNEKSTTFSGSQGSSVSRNLSLSLNNPSSSTVSEASTTAVPIVRSNRSSATPSGVERPFKQVFKVIILGDSGVGKTCLTYRLCSREFLQRSSATVGVDFREKTIQVGSQLVKLQLWDTAGQERFRKSMVPHYYRNVHAVVYVYDINNVQSFDNVPHWMGECERYSTPGRIISKVLVGNKCDAATNPAAVPTHTAQQFADLNQMALFETSAKDDSKTDHVESIFVSLIYDLVSSRRRSGVATPGDERRQQLVELKPSHVTQRNQTGDEEYECGC